MTNPYQFITEIFSVATEMYKVKNKLSPSFMQEIFHHMGDGRKTRLGDKFTRQRVVSKGENSLRNVGPKVWNTVARKTRIVLKFV